MPQPPANAPIKAARQGATGVIQNSKAPTSIEASTPSHQARQEKLRSIWRTTGLRRSQRLANSCVICAATTTITK